MPTGTTDPNYLPTLPLPVPESADLQSLPAIVRDLVLVVNAGPAGDALADPLGSTGPTGPQTGWGTPTGTSDRTGNWGVSGATGATTYLLATALVGLITDLKKSGTLGP